MQAKNIHGENIEEIKSAFLKATADSYTPTLAIVFCSPVQDRTALIDFFNSKGVDIFGSTTAGEIIDDEVLEKSTVVMLLDMKKEDYKIFYEQTGDTYKISNDMAKFAIKCFATPSIIVVASGFTTDAEQIIKGVQDFDATINLFGGLAADDIKMKATYVFSNGYESDNGLLGLVINNDKISIAGLATSGWDNIGIEKTITKSKGNIVYTIDDEPAVDVFVKYFQFTDSVDNASEIIAANFAQYPLQLKKDNGNVVLRAPLMVDIDSRALIFAGGIPEGSKVKFSVPPGFDLVEKTANRVSALKENIPNADAVLMFSCTGRRLALGPMTEDEAIKIRAIWGKPLLGFFTYGEIGTAKGGICDFHNETCSMVILEEKN